MQHPLDMVPYFKHPIFIELKMIMLEAEHWLGNTVKSLSIVFEGTVQKDDKHRKTAVVGRFERCQIYRGHNNNMICLQEICALGTTGREFNSQIDSLCIC
jgi:hypothetical protein